MSRVDSIHKGYLEWLMDVYLSGDNSYGANPFNYTRLIEDLYDTEFYWILEWDEHRASDGIALRTDYADYIGVPTEELRPIFMRPCSIFELMVALARRGEDNIMWDPAIGDRTAEWFWVMVDSLGLIEYSDDDIYDQYDVEFILHRFLEREYDEDGRGGLFTIEDCDTDLRDVEIWYQMNWYFSSLLEN